jgi:hypothetical protein
MTREEYMFTLGYNGNQAMIDKTRLGTSIKNHSLEVPLPSRAVQGRGLQGLLGRRSVRA